MAQICPAVMCTAVLVISCGILLVSIFHLTLLHQYWRVRSLTVSFVVELQLLEAMLGWLDKNKWYFHMLNLKTK